MENTIKPKGAPKRIAYGKSSAQLNLYLKANLAVAMKEAQAKLHDGRAAHYSQTILARKALSEYCLKVASMTPEQVAREVRELAMYS